ncbi:unnamed protein product, partial [Effrenium voratum]
WIAGLCPVRAGYVSGNAVPENRGCYFTFLLDPGEKGTLKTEAPKSLFLQVDTVVTALHRNMDVLKKQKSIVVESMKGLYKTVNEVTAAVAQASDLVAAGDFHGACEVLGNAGTLEESSAWAPGILELRQKLQMLALAGASQQA